MNISLSKLRICRSLLAAAVVFSGVSIIDMASSLVGNESASVAYAQSSKKKEPRKTPAIRQAVFEKIGKVIEASQVKDFTTAIELLDQLIARHKSEKFTLNPNELANVNAQYAFIYYSQEKYDQAITYNERVVKKPDAISEGLEVQTRYTIAQLYFVVENYPKAVKALEAWFKVAENPPPAPYILLAQGYYTLEKYDEALVAVNKAMAIAKEKGQEPKEQWFLLLRALYFDKGDNDKVLWVLEELAKRWPKETYFTQLSSIYGQKGQDKKQLAAHDVAFKGWEIKNESALLNMAYLYMGADTPYRGARVMEEGIKAERIKGTSKNYTTMATAFAIAQEKKRALPYMEKAAETGQDGEPWASLATVYFDNEQYSDALKASRKALSEGGLKSPENTRILIGMSLFNLGKLQQARSEFSKAREFASVQATANQWIKYIDGEIKRKKALENI